MQMDNAAAGQDPRKVRDQGVIDQRLLRRLLVPLLLDGTERQGGRVEDQGARHGRVPATGWDEREAAVTVELEGRIGLFCF